MVDAAICLPIFIIALAMMLQVIIYIAREENSFFAAENRIQTVGLFGSKLDLGQSVNDPIRKISIDHVQRYPIACQYNFPFIGTKIAVMDMPFRTYIGESPDVYADEYVYIFPKNEGSEKEGPKYHDKFCRTMKGGATKGLETEKITKEEAISRGYTHCHWCESLNH